MKKFFIAFPIVAGAVIVIYAFFSIANAFVLGGASGHVQQVPLVYAFIAATFGCLGWIHRETWIRLATLFGIGLIATSPLNMSSRIYPKEAGDISLLDWVTIGNSFAGVLVGIATYYAIRYAFTKDAKNCSPATN